MSSQSSLRDPTQVPTSVAIKSSRWGGGGAAFCLVRPGTRGASGGGEEGCTSPREPSQGNFRERFALAGERGKHRHVCLFLNKCLQARRGQTPQRPRPAGEVSAVLGPPAPPQPGLSCSNLARPWPGSDARSPPGRPGAGARGGAGRAEWGAAPAGATRGRTRGARAGAATGSRGEPPTSPAQGRGPPRTAGTWMRRSPSRGGRGAARAGDARREGRLGSGRRMAEVSGGAGQRRGALPDEGHLLAGGRARRGRSNRGRHRLCPSPSEVTCERHPVPLAPRDPCPNAVATGTVVGQVFQAVTFGGESRRRPRGVEGTPVPQGTNACF